jgi:hypothetical protein
MTHLYAEIEPLLRHHLEGNVISRTETVHTRSGNRGGLLRLPLASGGSVIVKVWRLRNLKEQLKSFTYLSNGHREWRIHRLIHKAGVHVPEPLIYQRLTIPNFGPCEIMVIEDVGETECGVPHLKRLIATGRDNAITMFEGQMINITAELLKLKILDVDNQLNNFLIDSVNCVFRIDFECAHRRFDLSYRQNEYATMLDRLLRSHLHATYPESERTSRFMLQVATSLSVPAKIRQMATEITRNELQKETKKTGIEYAIALDW